MSDNNADQTFWEHLDDFRSTLIRIIVVTVVCGIAAFILKEALFAVVLAPSNSGFITYHLLDGLAKLTGGSVGEFTVELINTSLAQQFIIHMKTALYAGLLCALPYTLYEILRFISPAFYTAEKRYIYSLVSVGYVMFLIGVLICYFLIFPFTFRFLGTYQVSSEVTNMISLDSYISTLASMCLMLGVVFELPLLCWLLAKLNMLKANFMQKYRKHAVVVVLVLAAVITPTSDIFTLALVSVPMWLLYEISIRVVARTKPIKLEI